LKLQALKEPLLKLKNNIISETLIKYLDFKELLAVKKLNN